MRSVDDITAAELLDGLLSRVHEGVAADHSAGDDEILRSCGRPIEGVELRIVDASGKSLPARQVGEVMCRSSQNMKGYWNRTDDAARTLRSGWLHTGDAGFLDENGYLFIHDRLKDMIVSGGENVYPAEIESALYGHTDIADVAVIGVPDDRWGEAVKALIVLKTGSLGGPGGHTAFRARKAGGVQDSEVDRIRGRASSQSVREDTEATAA